MGALALAIRYMINRRLLDACEINNDEMSEFQFINNIFARYLGRRGGRLSVSIDLVDKIKQYYAADNEMTEACTETVLYKWRKEKINSLSGGQASTDYDVNCDEVSALIADVLARFYKKAPIPGVL